MSKEVKRYDALRDSAKKATPGPWRIEDDEDSAAGAVYITQDTPDWREPIARLYGWHDQNYLELADPTTILGLLAERDALLAERDALRDALEQAAQSLESISKLAGRDEFMQDVLDIRGFANSRATVARAALQGEQP